MELRQTCNWKILRGDNISCLWRTNSYLFLIVILITVQMTDAIRPTRGPFRIEETISALDEKKEVENQTSLDEYLQEFYPNQNHEEVASNIASNRQLRRRSGRHHDDIEALFAKITKEAERVKCGDPRPVPVDSYTELGYAKGFETKLFPDCIMIDRCKNSGCCAESEECRASRTINVTRDFFRNGVPMVKTVMKDIACECRKKPAFCPETNTTCPAGKQWNHSACKCVCKSCPKLFLIDEDKCTCDCLVSNRLCKNHAKGKRPISTEDCNCVKSGMCNPPQCINGYYDANLCKCVHVER